jgi:hypothetical protein
MFDLTVTESSPPASVRRQALAALSEVLTRQALLGFQDVAHKRDYLRAQLQIPAHADARVLSVDLQRTEALLHFFTQVTRDPKREALARLDPLLQLLRGPLSALEWQRDRMGARVKLSYARERNLRILLLPEGMRRRRVQIQECDREDVVGPHEAMPRCYGEVGQAYIGWALNRLDLRTLFLATVAYLREN